MTDHGSGDHVHIRHDIAATCAALDFVRDSGPQPFLLYVGYMHPRWSHHRPSQISTIRL